MIFQTLWHTLEELNIDNRFELVVLNINEELQEGIAIIIDTNNGVRNKWYWDKELDIWINENNK
jgi:hypothetical protein